jgi:hypothetical protein
MARKLSVRGRPKGTGVDDKSRLDAVTKLLHANPDMRPTTAIKAIGIDDPSAIRRLRDKYTARQQSAGPATTRRQAVALGAKKDPRKTSKPKSHSRKGTKKAHLPSAVEQPVPNYEATNPAQPSDFILSMYSAAIQSASAALEFQLSAVIFAFEHSNVFRAYENQVALGQSANSFLWERPYFPWTRH